MVSAVCAEARMRARRGTLIGVDFRPSFYDGEAVIEVGGREFAAQIETASTGQPPRRIARSLGGKASAVRVGWPGWRGHYRLLDRDEQAAFNVSVAQAVIDARSVTLRLPDGREALLDINGGRFTGLSEWPEQR